MHELRTFRVAISGSIETYGGIGEHDDLVIAVALALWAADAASTFQPPLRARRAALAS